MKTEKGSNQPKILSGTVISTKMKDTAVILVENYKKHSKYGKFIKRHKKFKAHDIGNTVKVGQKVVIAETPPISRDKHFKIVSS